MNRAQAEYRAKRRRYLSRFDGVLPHQLYGADLLEDELNCCPVAPAGPAVSSSSSGDPDGAMSSSPSAGVVVTVSRQNSVGSADAVVSTRDSSSMCDDDAPVKTRNAEVDAWSSKSLPGSCSVDDDEDVEGGRLLTVDRRTVSSSVPDLQGHRVLFGSIDDPLADAGDARVQSSTPLTTDLGEESRLWIADDARERIATGSTCWQLHGSGAATQADDGTTSQHTEITSIDCRPSSTSSSSSSSSPRHHNMAAISVSGSAVADDDKCLTSKQLLLKRSLFETS